MSNPSKISPAVFLAIGASMGALGMQRIKKEAEPTNVPVCHSDFSYTTDPGINTDVDGVLSPGDKTGSVVDVVPDRADTDTGWSMTKRRIFFVVDSEIICHVTHAEWKRSVPVFCEAVEAHR